MIKAISEHLWEKSMKIIRKINLILLILMPVLMFNSCSQIKSITQALENIKRLQFKLQNVDGFSLAGIGLNGKSTLSDFSITDGLRLTQAFATKSFPAEFILNVAAKNPNDGTGGSKQTNAVLEGLDWRLYIDDVQTVSGNIDRKIEIPGTGQTTIIPVRVSLDLYKFFNDKGYEGIINLALALGGVKSSTSRIKLDAQPTVSTPIGSMVYPGRITIFDKSFSS
jgi:hypothetical protein